MEELNIPTYRVKKIDSDEYVEGYVYPDMFNRHCYMRELPKNGTQWVNTEIDPATLAIHFPNMIDSKGNKVFASLREDGKGGDRYYIGDERLVYIALIHKGSLIGKQENAYGNLRGLGYAECKSWKVIGIQD